MKQTVLISGGAGFLGSHLCDLFLAKGYRVVAMDNMLTGNENNIAHLKKEKSFDFIFHNVSKEIRYPDPVHYILHFASPASPIDYQLYPIPTLKVGALGTHNTLGLAKNKKAVYLLASTSEVYGDPLEHPQKETYWGNVNPVGPRGVYDEAKRFAEAMTMAYHNAHQLDTKIVRIFNTYGPRMRLKDGRAIPAFIAQALTGQPLTIFGKGTQTRSFCYVEDLIDGIQRLLFSPLNDPINIGNPTEMTLLKLAETILKVAKSSSPMEFRPLPVDDPKVRQPDITKAKKLLGWAPKIKLEDGLIKTIHYFKQHLSELNA